MDYYNHWIPRPSFQTRLYHLHPCRRACAGMTGVVDSGLSATVRYQATQDNEIPGMPKSLNNAPVVIPAKAGIQWFTQYMLAQASMTIMDAGGPPPE